MKRTKYTKQDYHDHLKYEHHLSTLSTYLREIVFGGTDGIITTFAVVAGFSGAQGTDASVTIPFLTVLLFGFANLFGDAASMGLGNFLSVRADQDVYQGEKNKELKEIKERPEMEREETIHILIERGFNQKQAEEMTKLYELNHDYWLEFMMNQELEMPNPEGENAVFTGIATFIAFIIFGLIPLIPYVVIGQSDNTFFFSIFFTFLALVLLGILRWKVTTQTIYRTIGESVLLGGVAAAIAYFVGTFFRI